MLNIYVLEDHFIQQNRIEEVIHTILKKNNIKVGDFEVFDKPNQLLDFITERGSHQLFFLDIQWKWLRQRKVCLQSHYVFRHGAAWQQRYR